jgi:predicted MFS family arabinose efflux permease
MEGVSAILFTLVTEVGPFAYALRLSQGIAFVILFNCTATLVADHVPQARLGQAVGYLGLSMICTNALAPAVTEPLAAHFGWKVAFGVPGCAALLALFVIPQLDNSREGFVESKRMPRAPPGLGPVYYGSFLVGAGLGTLFTFVQPYALSQGATEVGQFFFGYVAAACLARGFFGFVPDRLGPARVAGAAMLLYAVTTVSAAGVTPATLPILGFFLGVSHGFIYPALCARGFSLTPPALRSVFMGWFACAFNTGFAISVLLLGPVADCYGFAPIFIGTGFFITSGVVPLLLATKARPAAAVL